MDGLRFTDNISIIIYNPASLLGMSSVYIDFQMIFDLKWMMQYDQIHTLMLFTLSNDITFLPLVTLLQCLPFVL